MLKRIGLIGDGALPAPGDAGDNVDFVQLSLGEALLPGLSAVVAAPGDWPNAELQISTQAGCMEELLLLLGMAIDAREQFHSGSSQRMSEHATRFAVALGLSASDRSRFERAAAVRDIGKLRVPNDVLLKKSVLTYDEWMLLQSHALLGGEIVRGVAWLQDTDDIVSSHHECFDGTGYPVGTEGEAIPLLGRALKILDVYCAMTSPRFYRPGYSTHEDAVAYIRGESGKHFDPELVNLFIDAGVGQPLPVQPG